MKRRKFIVLFGTICLASASALAGSRTQPVIGKRPGRVPAFPPPRRPGHADGDEKRPKEGTWSPSNLIRKLFRR